MKVDRWSRRFTQSLRRCQGTGRGVLGAVFLLLLETGCGGERPLAKGMNVLLITLDTTRADYVSPFGGDPRNTPNLQALADRSTIFAHAFSETNVTSPSHLTIMSGLRTLEHGQMSNLARVPAHVDTLPEAFQRAGYRTAGVPAASHVAAQMEWRGFDELGDVPHVLDATEVADRALAWLEKPADTPFFLWAHFFDPHTMYEPPLDLAERFYPGDPTAGEGARVADHEYFRQKKHPGRIVKWLGETRDPEYPRAMYAAEIHRADREIGRLLAALERLEQARSTVVVVVADHGESLGEHGIFYSHQAIYEQLLHIPLLVHVPGLASSRSNALVATLDVAPSISELTGVPLRHEVSGLSLVPLLRGQESSELAARRGFVHQQAKNRSVAFREDGWKLIWPLYKRDPALPKMPQLFHLTEDPGELIDLADEQPDRVRSMARTLRPWIELGLVIRGEEANADVQALEHLRALGYVD